MSKVCPPEAARVSVIHPLYSPYINRVLLHSGLPVYSQHFVRVKLNNKVEVSGGNSTCKAAVIESLWNIDQEKNDIKLEIFPYQDMSGATKIPGQSSYIKKGEAVNVVIRNSSGSKSKSPPTGLVFGFISLIPKPEKEEPEFQSFKDSFRSRFPLYPPAALREIVDSFKRSGVVNYDKALQEILEKSKNVQSLQRNLHTFLVNDFLCPSLLMEIFFQQLYEKFVSQQVQSEKYPPYQSILAKKFPENWNIQTKLDGTLIEYRYTVERKDVTKDVRPELIEILDD